MLKSDVIAYFGSAAEAGRQLGITRAAVSNWPDLVPRGSAYQVEVVTGGKLKVDPAHYDKKNSDADGVNSLTAA
jgi:hypothetical protein